MALRTPLTVSPHMYIGDSTGRPLDYGMVYFGEPDKDPEFYPIDVFSDDSLTVPVSQPVRTKGGYLNDNKGDMAEIHAKELIYSVKILDQYGRKIFYKGQSMRSTWNDDVILRIDQAIIDSANVATQVATDLAVAAIDASTVDGSLVTDALTKAVPKGTTGVARTQAAVNRDTVSVADFIPTGATEHTAAFNNALQYVVANYGGGTVHIPDGTYYINPANGGIRPPSNTELRGSKNTKLEATEHSIGLFHTILLSDVENVAINNIKIDGRKDLHIPEGQSSGTYYKDFRANPDVQVGEFVYGHYCGFVVTKAGTCGSFTHADAIAFAELHKNTNLKSNPVFLNTGTATLKYIQKSVGESGMGISLYSAKNIRIDDVQIDNCFGDGIYIGREGSAYYPTRYAKWSENVVTNNLTINGCRRQGISVISLNIGRFNNTTITNIGGTAPEGGVDFEPDFVDDRLKDIIFTNLTTTGMRTKGVVAYLANLYAARPDFDMAAYIAGGFDISKPIEQQNYFIESAREAGRDTNKVSITLDNWTNDSDGGLDIFGSGNTHKMGYIKVINSDITFSGSRTEDCCVKITRTLLDSPTVFIEDTKLTNNKSGARSHVWASRPIIGGQPMGGIHLKRAKCYNKQPLGVDTPSGFYISDPFKTTDIFTDISLIDCAMYPKASDQLLAIIGTTHTDKKPTDLVMIDNIKANTTVLPAYSGDFSFIWDGGMSQTTYRPDTALVEFVARAPKFPLGGGVEITLSNELCAVGSGKLFILQVPPNVTITNLPKNSFNAYAGNFQEIVIPAGSYLKLKIVDANTITISYMDDVTARATIDRGSRLVVPSSAPLVITPTGFATKAVQPVNLVEGAPYTVISSDLMGLTLSTTRNATTLVHKLTNNTAANITWSGTVDVHGIR